MGHYYFSNNNTEMSPSHKQAQAGTVPWYFTVRYFFKNCFIAVVRGTATTKLESVLCVRARDSQATSEQAKAQVERDGGGTTHNRQTRRHNKRKIMTSTGSHTTTDAQAHDWRMFVAKLPYSTKPLISPKHHFH